MCRGASWHPPRRQNERAEPNCRPQMRDGFGGLAGKLATPKLPCIPGGDVAGVVEQADEGSAFKPGAACIDQSCIHCAAAAAATCLQPCPQCALCGAGDRVAAHMGVAFGGCASHVVVPESALARIPEGMSFEDAAAVPLAGLTAWQVRRAGSRAGRVTRTRAPRRRQAQPNSHTCVAPCCPPAWQALELGRVKAGDRVLIHAGAGGVGTFSIQARSCGRAAAVALLLLRAASPAVQPHLSMLPRAPPRPYRRLQLAKARGAFVATTCSAKNADFVRSLGADEVVDYATQRFEGKCQGHRRLCIFFGHQQRGVQAASTCRTERRMSAPLCRRGVQGPAL